jgi:hypothetical protein
MNHDSRRIQVIKLIVLKSVLKHYESFSENVTRCNFSVKAGWRGKTYVDKHDVDDYQPEDLRGIVVVTLYYINKEDYVTLTAEQYADYQLAIDLLT